MAKADEQFLADLLALWGYYEEKRKYQQQFTVQSFGRSTKNSYDVRMIQMPTAELTKKDLPKIEIPKEEPKVTMTCKDVEVIRNGNQIILPSGMSHDEGIEWLKRKREEDDREVAIHYDFACSPLDGAVAFHRALTEIHGWSDMVTVPGSMMTAPRSPVLVGVPISVTETVQVPWGRIIVPGIDGHLETELISAPTPKFAISGKIKNRYKDKIAAIAKKTEELLRDRSIYRGQAIKVGFAWERKGQKYAPMDHCPKFISLEGVAETDLVFGNDVATALKIGLFTPIEYAAACRKYGVPLKRGILLHGPYGCGKTLTATVTALKGIRHGFTFIYLESVLDLARGLQLATQYAPAIIFAEDIDRALEGERSLSMDEILNIMDGCDTKGKEVMVVFTSNNIESINPALLRMGRLDTLVEIKPPDTEAAIRLVKLYGRNLFAQSTNFTNIGEKLAGRIPAFIREVTERAKIAAIARLNGGNIEGQVREEDLLEAAEAMKLHASLLERRREQVSIATEHVHLAKELLNRLLPSLLSPPTPMPLPKMSRVDLGLLRHSGDDMAGQQY